MQDHATILGNNRDQITRIIIYAKKTNFSAGRYQVIELVKSGS